MDVIVGSLAQKKCVAHKAFNVLAEVSSRSDRVVIDFCVTTMIWWVSAKK